MPYKPLSRRCRSNRIGAVFIASIWNVPDWMVQNPTSQSRRVIPRETYPEAIESIQAWLTTAREVYGVEVDYVSFNEPNIGVNVNLTSLDAVEFIGQSGARFADSGLKAKWLLGDCSSMAGCLSYVEPIWKVESLRPYLGPLSFHSWDAFVEDYQIELLGEFARAQGLESWCTEAGWDAFLWQNPNQYPKWINALQTAAVYSRVLKLSRATSFAYWEMFGDDYNLNDGVNAYPTLQVIRMLDAYFPAGSQVVRTSADKFTLRSVAALTPSGFVVLLTNTSAQAQPVQIAGLPNGDYDLKRLSENEVDVLVQTLTITDGTLELDLAPSSVNFIVAQNSD